MSEISPLMKTILQFIINPAGGGGKAAKAWFKLKSELNKHSVSYTEHFTKSKGDAIEIVKKLAILGENHFVAVGGDGTAHEVANGILLAQEEGTATDAALCLFSCGTGNDWVREHQISTNIQKFVQAVNKPEYRFQDVGLIEYFDENKNKKSRYFINVAGMAYDAFVAKNTEGLKQGHFSGNFYLLHVFKNLLKYKPEKVLITADNRTWSQKVYTINIGQCRFSGGNMQLVPHAVFDSGHLAVTIADSMPKWEIILQTPKFYNGKLLQHPSISGFECDEIQINSLNNNEVLIEADGEYLGMTPVKIKNLSNRLKVFGINSR